MKDLVGKEPLLGVGVMDDRLRGFREETAALKKELLATLDALACLHAAKEEGESPLDLSEATVAVPLSGGHDLVAYAAAQSSISGEASPAGFPFERGAALWKKLEDVSLAFEALRRRMMAEYEQIIELERERAAAISDGDGGDDADVVREEVERRGVELLQLAREVPEDLALFLFDDMLSLNLEYVPGNKEYHRSRRAWLCVGVGIVALLLLVRSSASASCPSLVASADEVQLHRSCDR